MPKIKSYGKWRVKPGVSITTNYNGKRLFVNVWKKDKRAVRGYRLCKTYSGTQKNLDLAFAYAKRL